MPIPITTLPSLGLSWQITKSLDCGAVSGSERTSGVVSLSNLGESSSSNWQVRSCTEERLSAAMMMIQPTRGKRSIAVSSMIPSKDPWTNTSARFSDVGFLQFTASALSYTPRYTWRGIKTIWPYRGFCWARAAQLLNWWIGRTTLWANLRDGLHEIKPLIEEGYVCMLLGRIGRAWRRLFVCYVFLIDYIILLTTLDPTIYIYNNNK